MKLISYLSTVLFVFIFTSCQNQSSILLLQDPMFKTESFKDAGIDSIGFLMRKHVIVATVKDKNELHVYGAMNGKLKKTVSRESAFPNGVTVIDDKFVLVTERDNKQVAVFNSSLEYLGSFGNNELRSPYGIAFYKVDDNFYKVFVTDSYEFNNPRNDRILSWDFKIDNETFRTENSNVFGNPTLYQVESIFIDKENKVMLVAEEMKEHHKIIALDLDTGKVIIEDIGQFDRGNDPEGIALVKTSKDEGYWICTEQSKDDNRFHLFDRKTLEFKKTLYLDEVSYTDGITTAYMHGKWYLYAVDNDMRIVSYELPAISFN